MSETCLLESFEDVRYPGTFDLDSGSIPSGLAWIHGSHMRIACKTARIRTLRVFTGRRDKYPCYDGMVIDAVQLPELDQALTRMQERKDLKEKRAHTKAQLALEHSTFIRRILDDGRHARYSHVRLATSRAGLDHDNLDPGLVKRIEAFLSGACLMDLFHTLSHTTKSNIWSMFPPGKRPPVNTNKGHLILSYIVDHAHHFQISENERLACVQRAHVARVLLTLSTRLQTTLTPWHLDGDDWRRTSVPLVQGLPWIIRQHVFRHACLGKPWNPEFITDRLAHHELCRSPHRRSPLVETCQQRFINTTACWDPLDPFRHLPHAVLEYVCTFLHANDLVPMIESSRSLAEACVCWFRRPHARDPAACSIDSCPPQKRRRLF